MACLFLLVTVAAWAQGAAAQTVTCNVNFTNIVFSNAGTGNIDVLPGSAVSGAGSLTTACTGMTTGQKVVLCYPLNNGSFALSSGGARQMSSGTKFLAFNIYQDSAHSILWNASGTGIVPVYLTSASPNATTPVYAQVLGSQPTVAPGAYTTTMTSAVTGVIYTGTPPACSSLTTVLGSLTFTVSTNVVSSCSVTTTNLNFGSVSLFLGNTDANNTLSVTCTNSTSYQVRLDGGLAVATDPTQRKMSFGANQITYGLYRDTQRSLPWGSTDGSNTLAGTGTATPNGVTVYGRIPPQTTPPPGVYTDTIVVVISFI